MKIEQSNKISKFLSIFKTKTGIRALIFKIIIYFLKKLKMNRLEKYNISK